MLIENSVKSERLKNKRLREIQNSIIEYKYCPLCSFRFTDTIKNKFSTKHLKTSK